MIILLIEILLNKLKYGFFSVLTRVIMYMKQLFGCIIQQICSLEYWQLRLSACPSVGLCVSPSYVPASEIQPDILVRTRSCAKRDKYGSSQTIETYAVPGYSLWSCILIFYYPRHLKGLVLELSIPFPSPIFIFL